MRFLGFLVALLLLSLPLKAQPLVTADWLASQAKNEEVRIVDVGRTSAEYLTAHIPGSAFTDYKKDGWRIERGAVPDVMNTVPALETLLGRLGVSAEKHVVFAAPGQSAYDMAAATRLYWTLKMLGHEKVSVLDGGLAGYAQMKLPLESGPARPAKQAVYTARSVFGLDAMLPEVSESKLPLVDARPSDEFLGINKSDKVLRPGTLAGAVNLPLVWMTVDGKGAFRKQAELKSLFAYAKVQSDAPMIVFCNTGHTASLVWFVAHELLGNDQARLYDGSLAEWTLSPERPLMKIVK
ncbi:3-mercaptopyruvate sulfurtransferase [Rhodospirillaceae bacterium LM-1]|nr:3-mercaptopyruvate sulfurtransferase [Rhodospirillaceae bacterium LM-1]